MLRYVVAALCGISLTGSVYMAGWHHSSADGMDGTCCDEVPADKKVAATPAVFKLPEGLTEVKNTKCIVMGDDLAGSVKYVEYKGKAYHICCPDCIKDFTKDPEKYVNALEKEPAKFGLTK